MRCLHAALLSLPDLSLLLCEPVTPFDHTEALHQQGHGRTLTLSAAPGLRVVRHAWKDAPNTQPSPCDPAVMGFSGMGRLPLQQEFMRGGNDLNRYSDVRAQEWEGHDQRWKNQYK